MLKNKKDERYDSAFNKLDLKQGINDQIDKSVQRNENI